MTICARAIGSKRPLFADWSVPLPPDDFGDEGLTLRTLIERVVAAEVRNYETRRESRKLDRVLTRAQIEQGTEKGRIAPEARESAGAPPVEIAFAQALQAFEDGLYLIIIDDSEQRDLEARVYLKPNSRITFVRLTFLAGA